MVEGHGRRPHPLPASFRRHVWPTTEESLFLHLPHQSVLPCPQATPATLTHLGWFLDSGVVSPRWGWTLFSATSVSTENVGPQ